MARANPQWQTLTGDALAIFHGPHAYVSPSFYVEAEHVPTPKTRTPQQNRRTVLNVPYAG